MPSSDLLTAQEHATVEELVLWGTKVKDVAWVVRKPAAEALARKIYSAMNKRPPNGPAGSATSRRLTVTERMQYVAMAGDYQECVRRGTDRNSAMLAVYRWHFQRNFSRSGQSSVGPSVWMELSRKLDCGIAEIVRCGCCNGKHVVERETALDLSRCIWCSAAMPEHKFIQDGASNYRKTG